MILDVRFPAMGDHPPGDEIVVIRVQLIFPEPPFLVGEGMGEAVILQNLGAIGHRAPGQAGDAAVNMGGGRAVEVPSLQIHRTQKAPDALGEGRIDRPTQPLARDDAAITLVLLEGGQDPRKRGGGPTHVVVGEDGDGRPNLRKSSGHLAPLVGVRDGKQANSRDGGGHGGQHRLGFLAIGIDGHEQEFIRAIVEDGSNRLHQFISTSFQGRNNDRDILRSQLRIIRDGDRFERVKRN